MFKTDKSLLNIWFAISILCMKFPVPFLRSNLWYFIAFELNSENERENKYGTPSLYCLFLLYLKMEQIFLCLHLYFNEPNKNSKTNAMIIIKETFFPTYSFTLCLEYLCRIETLSLALKTRKN